MAGDTLWQALAAELASFAKLVKLLQLYNSERTSDIKWRSTAAGNFRSSYGNQPGCWLWPQAFLGRIPELMRGATEVCGQL